MNLNAHKELVVERDPTSQTYGSNRCNRADDVSNTAERERERGERMKTRTDRQAGRNEKPEEPEFPDLKPTPAF